MGIARIATDCNPLLRPRPLPNASASSDISLSSSFFIDMALVLARLARGRVGRGACCCVTKNGSPATIARPGPCDGGLVLPRLLMLESGVPEYACQPSP